MERCIIGCSGHYGHALKDMKKVPNISLARIVPDSDGRFLGSLERSVANLNMSRKDMMTT